MRNYELLLNRSQAFSFIFVFIINNSMHRTISIAPKVSPSTHRNLDKFLLQQRDLKNGARKERMWAWENSGDTITLYDQCRSLTQIRKEDKKFAKFDLHAQRTALIRIDKSYKDFYRRSKIKNVNPGYPRFMRGPAKSFETDQFKIRKEGPWYSVKIKGIGKFKFKKKIEGIPELFRVIKTAKGLRIQFVCKIPNINNTIDDRTPIGIDVGVTNRITLSTGEQIPKREVSRKRLEKLQRKVSKAKWKSKSRKKKVRMLAKEHQRVAERNKGELHEITASMIKNHSVKFYIENLDIKGHDCQG